MARPIPPAVVEAHSLYAAKLSPVARVSQAELQRLSCRLEAGDTPAQAADWVQGFFALHEAAMDAAKQVEPGAAAQAAYDRHCATHGARYGHAH